MYHVDLLKTSADCKDRNVGFYRATDQGQGGRVALGIVNRLGTFFTALVVGFYVAVGACQ